MFGRVGKLVWRRPWATALVAAFLLLLAAAVSLPCYALQQWHAAQEDMKANRYAAARGHLEVCLFVWPDSVAVRLLAARAARMTGHLPEAEAHLNRCLKLRPADTDAVQLEFLLMRVQGGDIDEVAPTLRALVDNHHAESSFILETLAAAYMHDHRYGPALTILDRWVRDKPEEALPLFWRGWVLERLNNYEEALKDCQQALALAPDVPAYRLKVAEMLLEKKNTPEALTHLELLHRQFPERADVTAVLGECRFLEGRLEEARPLLEAAVEQRPDDPPLLGALAKLELQEGEPVKAERWVRHLLKVDPADLEALFTLHNSLRVQGRKDEAAAALGQYETQKNLLMRANRLLKDEAGSAHKDAATAFEVGDIFLRIGQQRLGVYWLHQALERDPGHRPSHKRLAEYYTRKGDWKQAAVHRQALAGVEQTAGPSAPAEKFP